jgi:hypothetical protein
MIVKMELCESIVSEGAISGVKAIMIGVYSCAMNSQNDTG